LTQRPSHKSRKRSESLTISLTAHTAKKVEKILVIRRIEIKIEDVLGDELGFRRRKSIWM
jgi:hypothetical protein